MPTKPQKKDQPTANPELEKQAGAAVKTGEQPEQVEVDDQIRSSIKDKFLSRLFNGGENAKADGGESGDKADDKPQDQKAAKKSPEKKTTEPAAQPEQEEVVEEDVQKPLIDEEKLAKAISSGNEALVEAIRKSQEPVRVTPDPIPEVVAKQRHIYDKLSEIYPQKYPNQTNAMAAFARAEAKYSADWEEANGEQFDPDDERHNAWYAKNMPKIDGEDLEEAKIQVRLEKELSKIRNESKEEVESVRREIRERDFKSEADKLKDEAYKPILAAIDSELADTDIADLAGKDKLANKIVHSEVDRIFPFIQEIARLERRIVDYDASNPDHKAIAGLLNGVEEAISSVPQNKQVRDGKKFVTRKEWSKLSQKQKDAHWIVSEQDLRNNVLSYIGAQAKQKYDELRELLDIPKASGQGGKSNGKASKQAPNEDVPAFLSASAPIKEAQAPSIRAATQINAPASKGNSQPKTGRDLFMERIIPS